jgi:hypothetical protein
MGWDDAKVALMVLVWAMLLWLSSVGMYSQPFDIS